MDALQYFLYACVVVTSALSVFFSFSRRKANEFKKAKLLEARMNISMGLMLIFIALIQILLFSGTTVRVVVGSVFLLIGLFNLFAGLRNHTIFSRLK